MFWLTASQSCNFKCGLRTPLLSRNNMASGQYFLLGKVLKLVFLPQALLIAVDYQVVED